MHLLRSARWILLALLLSILSASAYAGVFVSVGFAPPPLPVYEQPPCPEPGLMWTPGYWAYGPDGYYWVPGAWVPAPQPGFLWTPPYWGWSNGLYVFHSGYWGLHVGFYGGVNYGFGYGGIGFSGGEWRHGHFAYNTAVMHVGFHGGLTFVDRGRVDRGFVDRGGHVAFSGGPGGIRHEPGPEERMAEHDRHLGKTAFQQQHVAAARNDKSSYFKSNGGHPAHMVAERPLGREQHTAPPAARNNVRPETRTNARPETQFHPAPASRPAPQSHQSRPETQFHPAPAARPAPQHQSRPAPQFHPAPHPAPQSRPEAQPHRAPAPHEAPREEHKH